MHMEVHFKNIEKLYGKPYIQLPNDIFGNIMTVSKNVQQMSFSYSYIVLMSIMYKYAHFVDLDNGTYVQNSDLKEILGYNRNTKSVDVLIKKNGLLEEVGLIKTTKQYPVDVRYVEEDSDMSIREFITIDDIDKNSSMYKSIKSIVKNRNYEIKEPIFFFQHNDGVGTLYEYANTFTITLKEVMRFICDDGLDNIDLLLYSYFKRKCNGMDFNTWTMPLRDIFSELKIGKDAFYNHVKVLEDNGMLSINHKGWRDGNKGEAESNDYTFLGI